MPLKPRAALSGPAAAAAGALALIAPALLRGRGLLPTTDLWRIPPWNAVMEPVRGNGLLADQLLQLVPWREFLRAELLQGRFPLWNPRILAGAPFAGCVQAAPFHPLSWGLFFLPAPWYGAAAAFLKVLAAGVFTALHLRRLGASPRGQALGALTFSLGGFMVAWLGHPHAAAACLLPALFWGLGRLSDAPSASRAAALGAVAGLVLLAGHPPTALHAALLSGAYAFFLLARAKGRRAAFAGWALAAAGLGFMLAAPALLAYLEYHGLSSTADASAALGRWRFKLPLAALLHLVMPLASGSPARGAEVLSAAFALPPGANFLERAGWTGLVPLLFAALAVSRRRRDPEVLFHAAVALLGLGAALGLAPLPFVWRNLPALSAVNPTRLLLAWTFGVAVLAGLGAEEKAGKGLLRGGAALAGLALLWYAAALRAPWGELTPSERAFAGAAAALLVIETAVALRLVSRPAERGFAPAAAALFALLAGWGVNPAAPRGPAYPETPGIAALKREAGDARFMSLGWALAPDTGMAFGLKDARGRDWTTPRRYEELVAGAAGDFDFWSDARELPPNPGLLGVRALAASPKLAKAVPPSWPRAYEGDLVVFRAPGGGSRALFVPAAQSVPPGAALASLRAPGFHPGRVVYMDDGPVAPPPARRSRGSARVVEETPDRVELETVSDGPGWLLLLDNWFPGWEAEKDGLVVPLRRADHAFRAVEVGAGTTRIVMTYRPRPVRLGLYLAALGLLLAAAAFATRRRSGPRPPHTARP